MKWTLLTLLCLTVVACNRVTVRSDNPGVDFNGDGQVGFSDYERGRPPEPGVDFERSFDEHMDKQDPQYKRRIRQD